MTSEVPPQDVSRSNELLARGDERVRRGESLGAEQYFALAWQDGQDMHQVLPRLLEVCLVAGRFRSALDYVERGLREDPADVHLRQIKLTLLLALGQVQEAAEEARSLTRDKEAPAEAYFLRGTIEAGPLRDFQSARDSFREYLKRDPTGRHRDFARSYLLRHGQPGDEGGGS